MRLTVAMRTPERLVLRLTPHHAAAYWGFGLAFIGLGAWAGWMLRVENPVVGIALGGMMLVAGLVCIFALESSLVALDSHSNTATVWNMRWARVRKVTEHLPDVEGADRVKFTVRHATSWYVNLVTEGRRRVPLTGGPMFTDQSSQATIREIEQWLEAARAKLR